MIRLFEDKSHADAYKKYRTVSYPEVIKTILDFLDVKLSSGGRPYNLAVDVGCGSGQHTVSLAPHFRSVLASDISESQIEEARRDPHMPANITYSVGPGEYLSHVSDSSAELVTGGTSIHWLDLNKFYKEVDRVLVPNGVMAAICARFMGVAHPTKSDELSSALKRFLETHLLDKKHEKISYPAGFYRDLPLPYPDELRIERMVFIEHKTVADAIGRLTSSSSYQTFFKMDPAKALEVTDSLQLDFLRILESNSPAEDTLLDLEFNYSFAMARKPEQLS